MPHGERITTRGSEFWIDGPLVRGTTRFDAPHGTTEDAVAALEAIETLSGGVPTALLFDARHVSRYDREARSHMLEHAGNVIRTAAVVINSRIFRAASYFFLGLRKPPFPVGFFTNEEQAERWIQAIIRSSPKTGS